MYSVCVCVCVCVCVYGVLGYCGSQKNMLDHLKMEFCACKIPYMSAETQTQVLMTAASTLDPWAIFPANTPTPNEVAPPLSCLKSAVQEGSVLINGTGRFSVWN